MTSSNTQGRESWEENIESSESATGTTTASQTMAQQGDQADLNALIWGRLPQEVVSDILEVDFLARWAIKITANQLYERFVPNRGPKSPTWPTCRAMLLRVDKQFRSYQTEPAGNVVVHQHTLNWVVIPFFPARDGFPEISASCVERGLWVINNEYGPPEGYMVGAVDQANHALDEFRLAKILENTSYSKFEYKRLGRHFFGHITWVFTYRHRIHDVVENPRCRLRPKALNSLRSICLEVGHKKESADSDLLLMSHPLEESVPRDWWDVFLGSFEYLFALLARSDSPLPNITLLEIRGQDFDAKKINVPNDRVIDETVRARYLVTKCFQLVKARPGIKILLSGNSKDTPTAISPLELPRRENRHRERRRGLGYGEEEVSRFSKMLEETNLPSLEVADVKTSGLPSPYAKYKSHFKLLFVKEWRRIWRLGLQDDNNIEGYQGVLDPESTRSLHDEQDFDPDESDHEKVGWWSDSEEEDSV